MHKNFYEKRRKKIRMRSEVLSELAEKGDRVRERRAIIRVDEDKNQNLFGARISRIFAVFFLTNDLVLFV